MHKLIINKLGPIDHCELTCNDFMIFTGFQSSGKSTIAKAIFYFRTIKNDIYKIIEDYIFGTATNANNGGISLKKELVNTLKSKFLRTFGSSWGMDNQMSLEYRYTNDCFVKIYLKPDLYYQTPNYIWIELSDSIQDFLFEYTMSITVFTDGSKKAIKEALAKLFNDNQEIVYIPAGRSMLTLLSQQLNYIYSTMDDLQKRTIDYCTQNYIEKILRLKPEFSDEQRNLALYESNGVPKQIIHRSMQLTNKILKGTYSFTDGEERIVLKNKKYVKINFASSGQQESVWILNLLSYYLIRKIPAAFIIEEPESNLFPESQKYISEFISLVHNQRHSMIITTHSPYILGSFNNLLYAGQTHQSVKEKAAQIIPMDSWLNFRAVSAWFIKNGMIEDCMDHKLHLVQNEKIDEISQVINEEYDKLFDLNYDE